MKFLLDTHVWLWLNLSPEKLTRSVRQQMNNPANELYLSSVSIWETSRLARDGRLKLHHPFDKWLREMLETSPVKEAPLSFAIAAEAGGIRLPQNDFGDVILAATASILGLTLVTSDQQLIACTWLKTLAN